MLETLSDRLSKVIKTVTGQARLSESNIKDALREVRIALLEADVALPIVKDFIEEVKELLQAASDGGCLFEDLFQGARTRGEAIGYFLAVLELAKQYLLTLTQDKPGSEIRVQRRTEEDIERLQAEESESAEAEPAEEHLLRGEGEEVLAEDRDGSSGAEAEANEGGESE